MSPTYHVASATVQLLLSNAVVRLLSFVTMPVLTHLLAPEAYGVAAMAGTFISLFSVIALAGMDMSYVRTYHAHVSPLQQHIEYFAWRYALGAGLAASVLLIVSWGPISVAFSLPSYLGMLLGIGVFFSLANTMTQTRARLNDRYRSLSVSIIVSGTTAAAISIAAASWWRQDELPLILAMVAGYGLPVLFLGIPALGSLRRSSGLKRNKRIEIFRIGLAGTITAPAYWVLSLSDRWFLGYFENTTSVGIYSIGYTVSIIGMMANSAVTSVWTPEAIKQHENNPIEASKQLGRLAERFVVVYACVWLAVIAFGGNVIRMLAAPAFHEAALLVPFLSAGVFFYGISQLANASLLISKKLDYAVWWWIGGSIVCVVLHVLLIPKFGRLGAAFTQAISFSIITAGIVYGAQKYHYMALRWKRLAVLLVVTILAGTLFSLVWSSTPMIDLMFKLLANLFMGFLLIRIIAPDVLVWMVQQFPVPFSQR